MPVVDFMYALSNVTYSRNQISLKGCCREYQLYGKAQYDWPPHKGSLFSKKVNNVWIFKKVNINLLVQGGQLHWAFPFSKSFLASAWEITAWSHAVESVILSEAGRTPTAVLLKWSSIICNKKWATILIVLWAVFANHVLSGTILECLVLAVLAVLSVGFNVCW